MGVPEDQIASTLEQVRADDECEVYEENWPTLMCFLRLHTQWRYLPLPHGPALRMGLDYAAVHALLRIERVRNRARVFAGLQTMESAVLGGLDDD